MRRVGIEYKRRNQGRSQEFAKGDKRGVWGRKSPSGVQGQSPGGGLGAKKPETRAVYSTEQNTKNST